MRHTTPRMRDFAERLIAFETKGSKSSSAAIATPFLACEKLGTSLATLLGSVGFSALLSRALVLARQEVRWLRALRVNDDGSLEGLAAPPAEVARAESLRGAVVLLAQLLVLLATFIGEDLTLRLVREVWPELDVDDPEFGKGHKK